MTAYSIPCRDHDSATEELATREVAVGDLFLILCNPLGPKKSFGQIYGLHFCWDQPLVMDEVMKVLGINNGAANQGLRSLRQLGAISSVYAPGDRKERFLAEIRLRKLVAGFLKEQADPHMEKGISRLEHLRKLLSAEEGEDSKMRGVLREEILSGWHRQMSRLLPLVKMIVGKSDRLAKKSSD